MSGLNLLSRHRLVALVTAGVVAGAAGGGVISQLGVATASSRSSSPSPSPSPAGPGHHLMRPGGGPDGPMGLLGGIAGGNKVLHGEATVEKPGGGTTVVRFQNGVISAIDGSTMTVKSTDGFTSTYTVNSTSRIMLNGSDGTLSKLAKSDKVRVLAMQSGSSNVAKMILDGVPARAMFGGHGGFGFGHGLGHREMPHQPPASAPGESGYHG
jgi:hypothetical protein